MTNNDSFQSISLSTKIMIRRFMLVLLIILLVYSIYVIDVYLITTNVLLLVVLWIANPSPSDSGDEGSKRSYRGLAMILYAEVARSNNPRQQLREKIEMMNREGKVSQEGILEILTFLKQQRGDIGDEAEVLLASFGDDLS